MKTTHLLMAAALLTLPAGAFAQVIGAYDNFDCFNDTGKTAEGFEIDVEDITPAALTREFPSNFSTTPWVIRYGLPKVSSYDFTKTNPDAAHAFDAGHKGVLITWSAKLVAGKWVAAWGNMPFGGGQLAGNGTPYVANPTLTNGDSCWYYGLGNAYPKSGCDHFGISFAPGVTPGRMTYHWLVPNATNTALVDSTLEASLPPSPVLNVVPPANPAALPVVHVVAKAPLDANQDPYQPQNIEPQYGNAYWVKTTTYYGVNNALLDNLQKVNVARALPSKTITWKLLQRAPGVGPNAGVMERDDNENDNFGNNKEVQVTKQYEYFKFSGIYDSETHEALCDSFYATQALALAGGATVQISCQNALGDDTPYTSPYWTIDPGPGTALYAPHGDLGSYMGAHINAYNVK